MHCHSQYYSTPCHATQATSAGLSGSLFQGLTSTHHPSLQADPFPDHSQPQEHSINGSRALIQLHLTLTPSIRTAPHTAHPAHQCPVACHKRRHSASSHHAP